MHVLQIEPERGPAEAHAARFRRGDPLQGTLTQIVALPLGEHLKQMNAGAARRCRRVDGLIERDQADVATRESIDELDAVRERARESIEFLDHDDAHTTSIDELEQLAELRPAQVRAGLDVGELKKLGVRPARRHVAA